jgi:hypothetical protein
MATTAAAMATVGRRRPASTITMAAAAASSAAGAATRRPSTAEGTMTWERDAPRLRASSIVVRRRRAARIPTSASVATATSAGPTAVTATMASAAAHSSPKPCRRSSIEVRIAVSLPAVRLADGYSTSSLRYASTSPGTDREVMAPVSRKWRHV